MKAFVALTLCAALASGTVAAAVAVTPASAATATSVYVVAVGDIACDPSPKGSPNYASSYNNGLGTKDGCRQRAVGDVVIAAKPDQFWALGDNQYVDGTYEKYMTVYDKAFGPVKDITRPIPGNHEWKDLTLPNKPGAGYFTYFGEAAHPESNGTYSFDAGDWHVLAINDNLCDASNPCGPGSALARWIAADMAGNQQPCTVAMWHHPLWSVGSQHAEGYVPMVPVWNQLLALGVDVVLTGHDHLYVRTKPLGRASVDPTNPGLVGLPTADPNGMVEFVIGTGGEDNYSASTALTSALDPYLATYSAKQSPGLFGAAGFHLYSDRYTFTYLPAADSADYSDNGGRTCRRATGGNPKDVAGEPVAPLVPQQVTWAPSNTAVTMALATGGKITPSTKATTNGNGAITYAVTSAGTTGCTVTAATGTITYTGTGQCEVTATAAATRKYEQGTRAVVFTIAATPARTPSAPSSAVSAARPSTSTSGSSPSRPASSSDSARPTASAQASDVTDVTPAAGPLAGGNTVLITGHGLARTTKVVIGTASAKFVVIDDAHVTAVVPAATQAGPVKLSLIVTGVRGSVAAPSGYVYSEAPAAVPTDSGTSAVTTAPDGTPLGNPAVEQSLPAGIVLLARADAESVSPTVVRRAPAPRPASAPLVRVRVGTPFALVLGGQSAGDVVTVRAVAGGASIPVGTALVDDAGRVQVPALAVTRLGVVTLGLSTGASGAPTYVRVRVAR